MNIYCFQCGCCHTYTLPEVERILYTMSGLLADMSVDSETIAPGAQAENYLPCLTTDILRASYDSEEYQEHTEQGIALRRAKTEAAE